ncbi:ZPR1 zinc finger domain-containing protein [Candidatus Woesearchaeota archaeon]|nr:ZPR1 zinc finger domain-containing protein [Candidatus Woesearchaeota archaeon]
MKDKKDDAIIEDPPQVLENQNCPFCHKDTLTLTEQEREIPFFGKAFVFSMTCSNCKYHKADVEAAEKHEPSRYSVEVNSEDDMKIRVVKSSEATVKIPRIMTIEPGTASQGFITNIEGLLNRAKYAIETAREEAEDNAEKKKAKSLLKKIQNIKWGRDKITITIDDPSGNSAIISEKAVKKRL